MASKPTKPQAAAQNGPFEPSGIRLSIQLTGRDAFPDVITSIHARADDPDGEIVIVYNPLKHQMLIRRLR